ncbi:MAG: pyridoxal phosphate-dependent aminotransferase [Rickettsia sp.]|nr:pyridoxal phosphate-dependent aminotransferase [Rickettsia sp.]
MILSHKMQNISPSKTLEISAKINYLKEQNQKIFALNSGEPEFDTADHVKQAAINAINSGFTKYTEVSGIKELKLAVLDRLFAQKSLKYSQDEVIISNGAKHVLFNLFMTTLNPGDEVVIIKPYWNSYTEIINILGGKIVFLDTYLAENFQPNFNKLSKLITKKTKWILLNYPNNPTGKILSEKSLEALVKFMQFHEEINLVLDEVYDEITLGGKKVKNVLELFPDLKNRVFIVNAVSKSHSMTGWRIGYGIGSAHIIKAMSILQSHSTSNPSSISQIAALEAVKSSQDRSKIIMWQNKFDILKQNFDSIEGLKYSKPDGGFYVFPDISYFIGLKDHNGNLIKNDLDLTLYLLEFANIAVIPGSVFGAPNHLRISFTIDLDQLKLAMSSFKNAMLKLKQ